MQWSCGDYKLDFFSRYNKKIILNRMGKGRESLEHNQMPDHNLSDSRDLEFM